jgi:hypothetical protein
MEDLKLIGEAFDEVVQEARSIDVAASEGQSVLEALLEEEMRRFAILTAEFHEEADQRELLKKQILQLEVHCKNSQERNRIVQDSERRAVHELSFLKQQHGSTEALKKIRMQQKKLENQTQRIAVLNLKLKEAEKSVKKATAEKEKVETLVTNLWEVKERVLKVKNYRKGKQGVADQTLVIQNKEVGPEQRVMYEPNFQEVVQRLGASEVPAGKIVPILNIAFDYAATMLKAKDVRLAHEPSQSTIDQIMLEMGPLTEFVAAKTWLDGGGKQVNFGTGATTMGGTDYMAEGMSVMNKEGGTDRFVLGWMAMPTIRCRNR